MIADREASSQGSGFVRDREGRADPAVAPGLIDTPGIAFGEGVGEIYFDHVSGHHDFTPRMSGDGSIGVIAGKTVLKGDTSGFSASTDMLSGATLAVGNGAVKGTFAGKVFDGGTRAFNPACRCHAFVRLRLARIALRQHRWSLEAIEIAVTRRPLNMPDPEPFPPADERISITDALCANPMGAARQLGLEEKTGSIEVGKFGDLVMLETNLLEVPPQDIHRTKAMMT